MTTRKEIIINKYLEFQQKLKDIVGDIDIFPSLEELDIVDFLIYFNMTFSNTNDYESIINDLIYYKNIKVEPIILEKAMPIITQFIDEFKLLQKSF